MMAKTIILLALWLMATPAQAVVLVGFGESSCSTQSFDHQFESTTSSSEINEYNDVGQSWTTGSGGVLYSLSFRRSTTSSASNITIRVGTGIDLSSSYLVEYTCDVPDAVAEFECVISSEDRPTLSGSTQYFAITNLTATYAGFFVSRSSGSEYAGGTSLFDSTLDWAGTETSNDYWFKTKMCD